MSVVPLLSYINLNIIVVQQIVGMLLFTNCGVLWSKKKLWGLSKLHKHPLFIDVVYPLLSHVVHFVRLYPCTIYDVCPCSLH